MIRKLFILLRSQPFNGSTFLQERHIATFSLIAFDIAKKNKGLEVYAYCIMSSHVHMIIARHGHVVRDVKKFTSVKITKSIDSNPQESRRELLTWLFEKAGTHNPNNRQYQFWQQRS